MTIKLSLKLQTTRIQKQIPLSVFVLIESLVVSALQDSGGYAISQLKKNLDLHLGCYYLLIEFFYIGMPVRTVGQSVGRCTIT